MMRAVVSVSGVGMLGSLMERVKVLDSSSEEHSAGFDVRGRQSCHSVDRWF